jgi:hypothetical protein
MWQQRRVLRELAATGMLPQVTRWQPVLAGWLVAGAVLVWKAGDVHDAAGRVTLLRVVAVLLVISVVNIVDDDAANLLAPVPVTLAWRSGVRFGLAAAAVAAPWAAALLWVRPGRLSAPLTLECAALAAFGLAVASGIVRWSEAREAGLAAGPAVLGAAISAILLPPRWTMFAGPDADWWDAHLRWAAVLGVATAVLILSLRDPAGRATAFWRSCARRSRSPTRSRARRPGNRAPGPARGCATTTQGSSDGVRRPLGPAVR